MSERNQTLGMGLALGLGLIVSVAWADDPAQSEWPAFRGPARDGKVPGKVLPTVWSPTQNVAWRSELPGQGWSSPVVVGDTIYLTAAVADDEQTEQTEQPHYALVLLRLDASTGRLRQTLKLFDQPADAPRIHKKNSHASPTPVFDGQRLFLHFGHQGTACVSATDGQDSRLLWRNDTLAYSPVHGNGGSPAIYGDLLVFSRDGAEVSEVSALSKSTGEVLWQVERGVEVQRRFSFCTPLILELESGPQLILPGSNVVQSLDPSTGKELWRCAYEGYSVIPRPIYESGLVFVCTGYDRPSLLAIDPTGQGDVTETHLRWQSREAIPHTPSLIGDAGKLYLVSDRGIASCYDAVSGQLLWKERIGGNFSASPLLAGSRLYLLSEEGVCTVLDISGDEPREVAVNKMDERCLASLAVTGNDLLLRTADALYRIRQSE